MLPPVLIKLSQLVGLLLLVGLPVFWLFVWQPTTHAGKNGKGVWEPVQQRIRHSIWQGSLAGLALVWLTALAELQRVLGALAGGLPVSDQVALAISYLVDTSGGQALLLRLIFSLGFLFTFIWARRRVRSPQAISFHTRAALFTWGSLLLLSVSLAGHAVGSPAPVVGVIADWFHLFAATVWAGVVVAFALLPWGSMEQRHNNFLPAITQGVARLSGLGLFAILSLTVTGILLAGLHIFSLPVAIESLYGRTLFAKLVVIGLLLAVAGVNRLWVLPQVQQAGKAGDFNPRVLRRLQTLLHAEAGAVLMILILTAFLTQTSPPTTPGALGVPQTWTSPAGPWTVEVEASSRGRGQADFRIMISGRESGDSVIVDQVELALDMPEHAMGLAPVEAVPVAPGIYEATGFVSMPGRWEATVRIVAADTSHTAIGTFEAAAGPLTEHSPLQTLLASGGMGPVTVVAGLLVAALGLWLMVPGQSWAAGAGSWESVFIGALFLAAGTIWIFHITGIPTTHLQSPIPPDASVALEARPLYEQHCAACHGPQGRGDGPEADNLRPRPVDFSVHVTHHTEGQFFWFITEGIPNTAMPAFRERLTEEERWLVTRYAWELGWETREAE